MSTLYEVLAAEVGFDPVPAPAQCHPDLPLFGPPFGGLGPWDALTAPRWWCARCGRAADDPIHSHYWAALKARFIEATDSLPRVVSPSVGLFQTIPPTFGEYAEKYEALNDRYPIPWQASSPRWATWYAPEPQPVSWRYRGRHRP